MKIGIFGCEVESINYGCSALAITQLQILKEIADKENIDIEYELYSNDGEWTYKFLREQIGITNVKVKYLIRLRTGVKGVRRLSNDIKQCDMVIDLTYGDSFSDIYGIKNFLLYSLPKIVAIKNKVRLVLGPQTYGPYENWVVKKVASYILKRADVIFARDDLSRQCAKKYTKNKKIVQTSDLAMALKYDPNKYKDIGEKGLRNIGVNISALLWYKKDDDGYKDLMKSLLDKFEQDGFVVHLVAHVFSETADSEYKLAKKLAKKYSNITVAPCFESPIDAKSYMCHMDTFIGSRMHATIGAFSAGVPIIAIAYSRKFEGLYNAIGYPYYINYKDEEVKSSIEKIMEWIEKNDEIQTCLKKSMTKVKKAEEVYVDEMKRQLMRGKDV